MKKDKKNQILMKAGIGGLIAASSLSLATQPVEAKTKKSSKKSTTSRSVSTNSKGTVTTTKKTTKNGAKITTTTTKEGNKTTIVKITEKSKKNKDGTTTKTTTKKITVKAPNYYTEDIWKTSETKSSTKKTSGTKSSKKNAIAEIGYMESFQETNDTFQSLSSGLIGISSLETISNIMLYASAPFLDDDGISKSDFVMNINPMVYAPPQYFEDKIVDINPMLYAPRQDDVDIVPSVDDTNVMLYAPYQGETGSSSVGMDDINIGVVEEKEDK